MITWHQTIDSSADVCFYYANHDDHPPETFTLQLLIWVSWWHIQVPKACLKGEERNLCGSVSSNHTDPIRWQVPAVVMGPIQCLCAWNTESAGHPD